MEKAIEYFKHGKFIIITDSINRENEADLVIASEFITSDIMTFFLLHGSGIICCPLLKNRAIQLDLSLMTNNNTDIKNTNFTISCDYNNGSTGISAYDRSLTAKALSNNNICKTKFSKPGHIFPLIAEENGVHSREGHTEASIDMCKICNLIPVATITELMNPNGTVMKFSDYIELSNKHDIPIINIQDIINYKNTNGFKLHKTINVYNVASSNLNINILNKPIPVLCKVYQSKYNNFIHTAIIYGNIDNKSVVPVRIHSECFTGHILHSLHCDCYQQFVSAFKYIRDNGFGVIIYVGGHEGRGIGLINKIKAYNLQNTLHIDTIDANLKIGMPVDNRNYNIAYEIIQSLNIKKINIITNNPLKYKDFKDIIHKRIHLSSEYNDYNKLYLDTKHNKLDHFFSN